MLLSSPSGARFALHDLGGDGPAVLICHATGFCGMAYTRLAQVLAPRLHVWAVDFAGHGDSEPPPDGDFSWLRQTGYLVEAVRVISPGAPLACVVGHSMGGAVALQTATEHPGLFASAYVFEPAMTLTVAPGPSSPESSDNPMVRGARRRQPGFPSKGAALLRYASRPPLNALEAGSLAAYVEHGFRDEPDGDEPEGARLKCTPASEAATFARGGEIAVTTVSAALPTLCVSGAPGQPLAAVVPPLAAALPRAATRVHHHLGHFGPLESPGLIGAEILAFCADQLNDLS